jgi:hypothetical protein
MDAPGLDQVHFTAQQVLEIREQATQVEQSSAFLQVYEEIDVTTGLVLARSDRAKHAHVTAAVQLGKAQNLSSLLGAQCVQRHDHDLPYHCPSKTQRAVAGVAFTVSA